MSSIILIDWKLCGSFSRTLQYWIVIGPPVRVVWDLGRCWTGGRQGFARQTALNLPPASRVVEYYGNNFTQRTLDNQDCNRKTVQVQLRNKLTNLLDIVKYLRQMACASGSGLISARMREIATRLDRNRPGGLSLAAFVRILKAANAAYTELHSVKTWCRDNHSVQGSPAILIRCDQLLLDIAEWKNHPYAKAEFVAHKQAVMAKQAVCKAGLGNPGPGRGRAGCPGRGRDR